MTEEEMEEQAEQDAKLERGLLIVLFIVFVALLWVMSSKGAYQGQANHPVLASYVGINPYQSAVTIEFAGFHQPATCFFDVYVSQDVPVTVSIPSTAVSQIVRTNKTPDPNGVGWLLEYSFVFTPPDPNTWNVDVIMTDTSSTCRPQGRQGRGIVQAPSVFPWATAPEYLWVQDPTIPEKDRLRGVQEAIKNQRWLLMP